MAELENGRSHGEASRRHRVPLGTVVGDMADDSRPVFTGILRDISQRKEAEQKLRDTNLELAEASERLRSLSVTDEVTGVSNRRGFLTRAEEQLKLARRIGCVTSLFFVDVDDLKRVNDSFGHAEGDAVLAATAGILRDVFRESDLIARIGGDEFGVLAMNTAEDGSEVSRTRLRGAIDAFNERSGHTYFLSLSMGQVSIEPLTVLASAVRSKVAMRA